MRSLSVVLCALLAACAMEPELVAQADASLAPGSIGVVVEREPQGLEVAAVRNDSAAAGLHRGDIILRYNGAAVKSPRDFNRLMVGSRPGSMVRIDLMRDGTLREVQVPVREMETMPLV